MNRVRCVLALLLTAMVAACGGGGGGGGNTVNLGPSGGGSGDPGAGGGNAPPDLPRYEAGVFPEYTALANVCESPRPGTSDVRGSAHTEKMFLRSWSNDLYLWYREIPDRDPAAFSVEDYFLDHLKSNGRDEAGQRKDRFHFTYDTDEWEALSQSGVDVGYGVQWSIIQPYPPRDIVVAFVEPGSPAERAGVRRGDGLLQLNGRDVIHTSNNQDVDLLNAALWPQRAGQSYEFAFGAGNYDPNDVGPRFVTLRAERITLDPVPIVRTFDNGGIPVGYLLFNDHIATAEYALVQAIETLRDEAVQELVLDLRYNGGGYLAIAGELAYMIAGPGPTAGRTFEALVFNDKHTTTNPLTGLPLAPMRFLDVAQGYTDPAVLAAGIPLPTLNLPRVYVITGENTCSASEAIINGLSGVGVDVVLIGDTTCGKPYGYYPEDNCGTTYFSVQFKTANEAGFGEYSAGFTPRSGAAGVQLPGCPVADDLAHELGDVQEARLRTALAFNASNHQSCDTVGSPGGFSRKSSDALPRDGQIIKPPTRTNRLMQ